MLSSPAMIQKYKILQILNYVTVKNFQTYEGMRSVSVPENDLWQIVSYLCKTISHKS